jgi:hypothetical protein
MSGLFEDRPIDLQQMLKSVQREIIMRTRVYPRWVSGGKMTQEEAKHELATMSRIGQLLAQLLGHVEPPDGLLEAMAKAHDQEESAQRGEPSPWSLDNEAADFESFRSDRLAAIREAWKAIRGSL